MNAKQFIEKTLAKNKLLVVANTPDDGNDGSDGSNNQQRQQQSSQNGQNQNRQNGNQPVNNSKLKELNKKAVEAYNSAPTIV